MTVLNNKDIAAAGFIMAAAYSKTSHALVNGLIDNGWTPVGAAQLGMDADDFGATASDSDYLYIIEQVPLPLVNLAFYQAEAFAAYKDGTLAIGLAGTHQVGDWLQNFTSGAFSGFWSYQALIEPFFVKVLEFYNAHAEELGLEKILLAGHSLGGATVENLIGDYRAFSDLVAVSFAAAESGGSEGLGERLFAIDHSDDPVVDLGFGFDNTDIELLVHRPEHLLFQSDLFGAREHYRKAYLDTARHLFGPIPSLIEEDELDPSLFGLSYEDMLRQFPGYFDDIPLVELSEHEVYISESGVSEDIRPGEGRQIVFALDGNDTVYGGGGADLIDGGWGNDSLLGEDGSDVLHGHFGDDTLDGGSQSGTGVFQLNDTLSGDDGNDVLRGHHGADVLLGGAGIDLLSGGSDADVFVFSDDDLNSFPFAGADRITDYNQADTGNFTTSEDDLIDLSRVTFSSNSGVGSSATVRLISTPIVGALPGGALLQVNLGDGTWRDVARLDHVSTGQLVQIALTEEQSTSRFGTYFEVDKPGDETVWSISPASTVVSEGVGVLQFTLTRTGDQLLASNVVASTVQTYGYSNLGDYVGLNNKNVTFAAGQASATVGVEILEDGLTSEGDETFGLVIQNDPTDSASTYILSTTFTISDDETSTPEGETFLGDSTGETWVGSSQGDLASGAGGNDSLDGLEGDDSLFGGHGDDTLVAGDGNDFVFGGAGINLINSGSGNDIVSIQGGSDSVFGESGDDTFFLDTVDQEGILERQVDGGAGQDRIIVSVSDYADDTQNAISVYRTRDSGYYRTDSTSSTDQIVDFFQNAGDHQIYLNTYANAGSGDPWHRVIFSDIETIEYLGGAYNDLFADIYGAEVVRAMGGGGVDALVADWSEDAVGIAWDTTLDSDSTKTLANGVIVQSIERVILQTGDGNDSIGLGSHDDYLSLGAGDDVVTIYGGNNTVDGGFGLDEAHFDGALAEFAIGTEDAITSVTRHSSGETTLLERIELLVFDDAIFGSDEADQLIGNSRSQVIVGFGGPDSIDGGGGLDTLTGGDGNDTINGGSDIDSVEGGAGADSIIGYGGDDQLSGGADNDFIDGKNGDDYIYGRTENDLLIGWGGRDRLRGNAGDDTMIGGNKNDFLQGGSGADVFVFNLDNGAWGKDYIKDMELGVDRVVVEGFTEEDVSWKELKSGLGVMAIIKGGGKIVFNGHEQSGSGHLCRLGFHCVTALY